MKKKKKGVDYYESRRKNNKDATYVCINYGEAMAPDEIKSQSICIDGDIGDVILSII